MEEVQNSAYFTVNGDDIGNEYRMKTGEEANITCSALSDPPATVSLEKAAEATIVSMETTAGATTVSMETGPGIITAESCVRVEGESPQLWNCSATVTITEKDLAGEDVTFTCKVTYKGQDVPVSPLSIRPPSSGEI